MVKGEYRGTTEIFLRTKMHFSELLCKPMLYYLKYIHSEFLGIPKTLKQLNFLIFNEKELFNQINHLNKIIYGD